MAEEARNSWSECMGVETAIIGGGLALYGANQGRKQQKKAEKHAKREARAQRQMLGEQRQAIRAEQERTNAQIEQSNKKLTMEQARSNKRRVRGGLFGDNAEQQAGTLNPRLG
jgi:hypothetical protein